MSQLTKKLRDWASADRFGFSFYCPGCESAHAINTNPGGWGFNGDIESPTFTPSVLVTTGRAVDPSFIREEGDPPEVCHSFVTDGRIQFLGDCTHALAGQTVPLADFPEHYG